MVTKGGTSLTMRAWPPTIASEPMRQNWCTATPPETKARGPTATCPPSITLLVRMALVGDRQSWPTWALAISRQWSPIVVWWSASRARWIVTFSRIVLPEPMTTRAGVLGHVDVLGQAAQHGPLEDVVAAARARSRA